MLNASCLPSIKNSKIEKIPPLNNGVQQLFILRDDLIHPIISGNKWRKLKQIIERVKKDKIAGIQTYGGAYSNHLLAVAWVAKLFQIPCILKVRGEELNPNSNEVLRRCQDDFVQMVFLSREKYRQEKTTYGMLDNGYFSIPEGGACKEGIEGVMEIGPSLMNFDVIAVAQGTTTTSLGILLSTPPSTILWVFPVLKGYSSLEEMEALANKWGYHEQFKQQKHRIQLFSDYHFGGYGKGINALNRCLSTCDEKGEIPLDSVYTGKAFYGFLQESGKMSRKRKMIFIHTGGYAINRLS